jgi:transcription antitermination factor NusG
VSEVKIGDVVRVMLGSYKGKIGKIKQIRSRVKQFPMRSLSNPFDTLYAVQILGEKKEIYYPEEHLKLIN